MLVGGPVVGQILPREGHVEVEALQSAACGHVAAVTRVTRPAEGEQPGIAGGAELVHVVDVALRQPRGARLDLVLLEDEAEAEAVQLGVRDAQPQARARGADAVVAQARVGGVEGPGVEIRAQAHAVVGEVRVHVGDRGGALGLAGIDLDAEGVAGPQEVGLVQRHLQEQLVGRGVAGAKGHVAGGAFGDLHQQIHLVGHARHGHVGDLHVLEVAQTLDPVARERDLVGIEPGSLELAQLAADDLITGALVAGDGDAPHVGTPARIDVQRVIDLALLPVDGGHRVDAGKGVADGPQVIGDLLLALGELLAREGVTGPQRQRLAELLLAPQGVATKLEVAHLVALAFPDGKRDVDLLAVGVDGDLRGLDAEFQVAAVQVERAQRLQVARQLLARVLVGLGVPGQPVGRGELDLVEQLGFLEHLVAQDADLGDAGAGALIDGQRHRHPVAGQRRDGRGDLDRILAARQVLAADLLLGPIQHRAVEDACLGQPGLAHGLLQRLGVELARAAHIDRGDGRAFFHPHHQHLAVTRKLHVLEEAGGVEGLDRLAGARRRELVADADGQIAEDGTGFGTLQALYADVADDERRERQGLGRPRQGGQAGQHDGGAVAGPWGEDRVFDTRFLGARPRQPESSIAQSEILWK